MRSSLTTPSAFLLLLGLLFFSPALPVQAAGTTYYVALSGSDSSPGTASQPFLTIQHGITTAISGDTVLIEDGTYSGAGNVDLDFGGRNVTVTSQNGPAKTIIDCGGTSSASHRGFYLHSGETSAVISGLTIEHGYETGTSDPASYGGGGIFDHNVGVTIQNCIFNNNTTDLSGGGIESHNEGSGTILVTGCTFTHNTASAYIGGGGGMDDANTGSGMVTVTNCTFTGNMAGTTLSDGGPQSSGGGGLSNLTTGSGTITVTGCTFTGNTALNGVGGGLFNGSGDSGGAVIVTGCTVTGNSATGTGGGLQNGDISGIGSGGGICNVISNYRQRSDPITVTNCTITGNSASVYGGGVCNDFDGEGPLTLTNCAITGNTAGNGGGIFNGEANGNSTYPDQTTVTNCTLTGNTANTGGGMDTFFYDSNNSHSNGYVNNAVATITLVNDIVYGDSGGEVMLDPASPAALPGQAVIASHCDVQGGYPGTSNIDSPPVFVNSPTDLHLGFGTHCRGAGTPTGAPLTTLDGYVRPNLPSIGAFEAEPAVTTLASSVNPSVYSQKVTFKATVTGTGGMPTGSITFTVDNTAHTTVTLTNGSASFSTSSLSVGLHSITTAYSGDNTFDPGLSAALTQTVNVHVNPLYVSLSGSDSNPGTPAKPFLTIQAAINTAINGDTVIAEDGMYYGAGDVDLDFGGRNIAVTSQNGPAVTTIYCGGSGSANHRGFTLHSGETSAVISGFTIEYGYESGSGGGINIYDANATVQNCILQQNTAQFGGGISIQNDGSGAMTVTGCVLSYNSAIYGGGGIDNNNTSVGAITTTGCTLSSNIANDGQGNGNGGGMVNNNSGTGTITVAGCTLSSNAAGKNNNSGGGGIDNSNSGTLLVENCNLASNTANTGGGLYNNNYTGTTSVINCAITGPTPGFQSYSANTAGGMYNLNYGGATVVTGCTLTGNSAVSNTGGIYNIDAQNATITFTNDIVYGDTGGETNGLAAGVGFIHCDIQDSVPAGTTDSSGNINADPKFVSAYMPYDLHLQPGSPCAGKGTSSAPGYLPYAEDYQARLNPPSIGAFEVKTAKLVVTNIAISRSGGVVTVTAKIQNLGNADASAVQITQAKLAGVGASAALPGPYTIPAGSAQAVSLTFTTSVTGPHKPLSIQGTSSGPAFSAGQFITVP